MGENAVHFQTSEDATTMSAFLPLATTERTSLEVRFVPLAAVSNRSNQTPFVVGTPPPAQSVRGHVEAERLGGLEA
jgi:hypothetical protein